MRNLVAAGGGEMIHRRKRIRGLERPRLVAEAEGMALMPAFVRVVLRTSG